MSEQSPPEPQTPAERVIAKCGGRTRTAELAKTKYNWVYRWTLEKGGTGGRVPYKAQIRLLEAARAGLVDLTPEDFLPDELRQEVAE